MLSSEQVAKNKKALTEIYNRIRERSAEERNKYVTDVDEKFAKLQKAPARAGMACPNQAHMSAASDEKTKEILSGNVAKNGAIISGYSDVLSAHQPFKDYPDIIKACLIASGMTAQVAAGVASMCDGITQGEIGMQLSLFSRDVIAQSVAIALSHGFDFAVLMGVCDKIAPGMVMGVLAEFGYLAAVFAPAGPMVSGTPDKDKKAARIKQAKLKKERGWPR